MKVIAYTQIDLVECEERWVTTKPDIFNDDMYIDWYTGGSVQFCRLLAETESVNI